MQCWYCGCDIPYELTEKIKNNQNNVCCERCCAVLSKQGIFIEEQINKSGLDLKEIHRQWIFILHRQVYGLLRNSRYTIMIREKKGLKNHQTFRLAKKLRLTSLEEDIPNNWIDHPNINRKDFMDYHEYRQRQLCVDKIFEASFLPLFQTSIKFVYDLIIGNHKIDDFHGKVQMEIIKDLMNHHGVSINFYERGTFLYYITIYISRCIYDLIKRSNQNPKQNKDLIEKITHAVVFDVSSKEVNNELLKLIASNKRKRFKSKYEMFQSDLIWNQLYHESFLSYIRWLIKIILELMNNSIDFSTIQGIKQDLVENLTRRNLFGKNIRLQSRIRVNLIIVLSRMIYTILVTQADKMNLKLHQIELKTEAINDIVEILMKGIIANNQICSNYLVELYAIQPKEFDYTFQIFRSELKSDMIFAISFKNHLFWLTRIVYGLVSSEFDQKKISQFEYTLINDLKKFGKKREKYRLSSEDTENDSNNIGSVSENGSMSSRPKKSSSKKDRRVRYHFEVPTKYKNDKRIVHAPAWKFFELLKDQAYPDLSIADFWSHLGFNKQYHQNLALHISQKLKKGVIYTPDVKTLENIAQIIGNDINIDKILRNMIIKEIKKLSGIRENKLDTHWTGWKQTREKCWKLIDEYLKKNPALKQSTNYGKLQKDLMDYLSTYDDIHVVLSRDDMKLEHIMKGIIAIQLLQADNPLPQEDIRKISGFNNNRHIRNIRNVLNIPLPISFRNKQLFNDPDKKLRKCSDCNEIKSYNDFRTHYKDTEVFRSECRACESKKLCIATYQKKLLALIFLTLKSKGKVDVDKFLKDVKQGKRFDLRFKCAQCDSDMTEYLPALDLNHLDPTGKQYEWNNLSSMPIDRIIRILNKKNIEIACANCHSLYHASTFAAIKDFILETESFEEVKSEIHGKTARRSARLSITKRKISEMLYGGVCQDCKKIGVDKIPALSFHHTQPELKTIDPREYINKNYQDIMKIKQKFLEEKLKLLCINCHRLEGSFIFDRYKQTILSKYLLD